MALLSLEVQRETNSGLTQERDAILPLHNIYVVPVLPPGYDYDNLHANVMDEPTPSTSAGAIASAPLFSFTA